MNDHDLLVCINVQLAELKLQFSNHLKHHFMIALAAWGTALGAIVTLAIYIITNN